MASSSGESPLPATAATSRPNACTTTDRHELVSEFFAVRTGSEPPQAAFGAYWTGLGLDGSPFGPDNPKVPRNACPGKEATRAGG
ncbi:hypothetical protein [Microbispora sp. NBRC 16548]|uniref:hypothetical protein n=1 Tax=Microbispora sp. NBRC 16548 TaxID=3030994 RepID=UPI0025554920|nr:hypothetical protein [Microbispora sp. NBRC 16548]